MTEDQILLTHILKCKPVDLLLNKPALTNSQHKQFQEAKVRLEKGEPIQYILGSWDFHGLKFNLTPDVLVPRPETETLTEQAIEEIKGGLVLDVGTGSGNIAITLAKLIPSVQVISVDISVKALEVARGNARMHRVEDRVHFLEGDILDPAIVEVFLKKAKGLGFEHFDAIVSNPPYIPSRQLPSLPKDVLSQPLRALDGGMDGLVFYRQIIKYAKVLLKPGAWLMMEFGDGQANAIEKFLGLIGGYHSTKIINDLSGRERVIKTKLGGV